MRKIFVGFILTLLDFELTLSAVKIDLLPDFIGWIVMILGIKELLDYSDRFSFLRIVCAAMTVISLTDLAGGFISLPGNTFEMILGLVSAAGDLLAVYLFIKGISEAEDILRTDFGSTEMIRIFVVMVITLALSYATSFLSYFAAICIIAHLIVCVIFLWQVFGSMRTYEKLIAERN